MFKFLKFIFHDWWMIPRGCYCYRIVKNKYKVCPFWKILPNYEYQNNGYCEYLKTGDMEEEGTMHLWDQVKECGIKINDKREDII